jgi:hypothetical protein
VQWVEVAVVGEPLQPGQVEVSFLYQHSPISNQSVEHSEITTKQNSRVVDPD